MTHPLQLTSAYTPSGDQPAAIAALTAGINAGQLDQVLLGVTGSGKTYTIANVIQQTQRPALIMAPNKTLAAQLYGEMKEFFPHNAVEYFVSYYDYYQPEAYVPRSDTFIEKEATINEQIDRLRHAATRALLERPDVIIVASVSCIYGLGSAESYSLMTIEITEGQTIDQRALLQQLVEIQYRRNDLGFARGCFRVTGDAIDIFPSHYEDRAWRISLFGDDVESITEFAPLTGEKLAKLPAIRIFANSHYVTPGPTLRQAIEQIKVDLQLRLAELKEQNKLIEYQRLEQRVTFDIEMLETTGMCNGIENYSRYLSGRGAGNPPPTLFEYLPKNALLIIDESHVTVSQVGSMYKGDFARKTVLAEYGFRLPSCLDNRPLKFEEWDAMRPQTIYVSATPAPLELSRVHGEVVEQLVRPTGLIDPITEVRPTEHQVDDVIAECRLMAAQNKRVLITTLTKKMAEDLADYFQETSVKARYLHSDIDALERIEIIRDLRLGVFDVLIGINLLREGLDIPECALVAILDADKEGFLRSKTSLVQTIGRAARNVDGRVILYADRITDSLQYAIGETERRRTKQIAYNLEHGITPQTVIKRIHDSMQAAEVAAEPATTLTGKKLEAHRADLEKKMRAAASDLNFEEAAKLRDEIKRLDAAALELPAFEKSIARASAAQKSGKKRGAK